MWACRLGRRSIGNCVWRASIEGLERKEPLTKFLASVDEVEKSTRLDFFWELEDDAEDKLEVMTVGGLW